MSYNFCRRISRQAKSSFALSYLLLPVSQRRAMEALYAFMRHTDDLGDSRLPVSQRRQLLADWRTALDQALTPDPSPDQPSVGAHGRGEPAEQILPALADTVHRFAIPAECLHAVIDGQDMDLTIHRYERFDDLVGYCEKVASAVGQACIYVWGFEGDNSLELARQCGIAFQLTNILRDVKEDLANGRVYLPQEDLRRFDYSVEDLAAGVVDSRFYGLMALEINRAWEFYSQSESLSDCLTPAGRRAFGLMCDIYRSLLTRIESRPEEVLRGRIRLSPWKKFYIAVRWILGRGKIKEIGFTRRRGDAEERRR